MEDKFLEKLKQAQEIMASRPEIARTHLARLVHTDMKRIREWERAGLLKFQTQINGWQRYGWSIKKTSG